MVYWGQSRSIGVNWGSIGVLSKFCSIGVNWDQLGSIEANWGQSGSIRVIWGRLESIRVNLGQLGSCLRYLFPVEQMHKALGEV